MARRHKPAAAPSIALRAAIEDIAARLAALPPTAAPMAGGGWYAAHHARQAATEELVGHIRREHGARIALGGNTERMHLHGIAVSCTGGTSNMIAAWLTKARAALPKELAR